MMALVAACLDSLVTAMKIQITSDLHLEFRHQRFAGVSLSYFR